LCKKTPLFIAVVFVGVGTWRAFNLFQVLRITSKWSAKPEVGLILVDKSKYIERLKKLYKAKNKTTLSEESALEYFEKLICLVETITSHIKAIDVIIPKSHEGRKF